MIPPSVDSDAVFYPVTDNVGQSGLQSVVIRRLLAPIEDYFAFIRRPVLTGGDQFFYYKQGDPLAVVCPDVYLVDETTTRQVEVTNWKVWERGGKIPALALEIVFSDYRKVYRHEILERYQQLGVHELIRYNPEADEDGRPCLEHWIRDASGLLVPRPALADRVRSHYFGFWIVLQDDQTLSLAMDPDGSAPWPTDAERGIAALRGNTAVTRVARTALETEIQRLRAEKVRLRDKG